MNFYKVLIVLLILILTFISGLGDAQGFLHASNIWNSGKIVWEELIKSLLGFSVGILFYIFTVKYLNEIGIIAPELQTIIWFFIAITGVAISNKAILHWQQIDQVVAILVIVGLGWLVFHHG